MNRSTPYRGRFAPSPTGPLHFGSLVAAMASYLDAKVHEGTWLIRIEDVDETRAEKGAADDILRTLEGLGFGWDGEVLYQTERKAHYREVIEFLKLKGLAYDCSCSRTEIARHGKMGAEGHIYPGTCRNGLAHGKTPRTVRFHCADRTIRFQDRIQGGISQRMARDLGDFVIRRADGYTAYQLAVVLDDEDQLISHVVRGADLLMSTPRQILLQQTLGLRTPTYAHVPLVLGSDGKKLSKQDRADPVATRPAIEALLAAYRFLRQDCSQPLPGDVDEFWPWALENWALEPLINKTELCDATT